VSDQNEKADLEQLLASGGWLRLVDRARVDWKDGYPAKIKYAIQEARKSGGDMGEAVGAVDYASDEINRLLSWPRERLAQIERGKDVTTTTFARGGYDTQTPR